ncbi:kinase-like protein [Cucurbitaria berberidis CBS 394.84]|uniref:Kinase-like protein n=1 Tax=Cucurbitaria berberidis CBS 394.84 TaxID=1168544 RepID=A0A9P4L7L5_9PLEO|nr:kinase-like protein [Cucurbitaria berberidis CBS 394.84]KAF1844429.1 kinase-like protein [Cucurbitaria berberidis CBS 394.84]
MNQNPADVIYVTPHFPKGVQHIITTGSCHYIGFINESTVLKYPHDEGFSDALKVECAILEQLGKHPRIIEFKGKHEAGLLLEFAPNGSLESHMNKAALTKEDKLRFARETAEAVAHAHRKNVIICDINVRNILLDAELHVKLCDFQGRLLGPEGETLCDGGASENAESSMPRHNQEFADARTDIFALGSTIYHIIEGHRPFPELHTIDDEAEFVRRYQEGLFPPMAAELGGTIVWKCWEGRYGSADEVLDDLVSLESHLYR